MGVEQANFLFLAGQKRDNAAVMFGNCDHALFQDDGLDEIAVFRRRMKHRQEGKQAEGRREYVGDSSRIVRRRRPSCEIHHRVILSTA